MRRMREDHLCGKHCFCIRTAQEGDRRYPSIQSSFGKLPRNDLVRRQWYSCPATTERNGGSSEKILGGVQTREQRQLPFSSFLGSGKKRRTGASKFKSRGGSAQTEPPWISIGKHGRKSCFPML